MKIKRYIAVNMRAALAQVRSEQGPDAVILSSRRTEEGIEVIAAVDYDEALFAAAMRQRAAAATVPEPLPEPMVSQAKAPQPAKLPSPKAQSQKAQPMKAQPKVAPPQPAAANAVATVRATPPAPVQQSPLVVPVPNGDYLALRRELKDLRDMMRGELANVPRNDQRLREPQQVKAFEALIAMDIADDVALALAKLSKLNDPSHTPLALLVEHMPVIPKLNILQGGVVVVVGPTGTGKTTTIAKLAARWSLQHGTQDLALVSTDRYRVGARGQLMTYDPILRAPVHTANSGQELAEVLHRLRDKKLILIDTAGMGPRDNRLAEQLETLRLGASRARVLLALPAHGEGHALEAALRSFARLKPSACILTKVDEAASLGAVISTTVRHKLPIAYLCNGQRVPEDLHAAHERRAWLVRVALKLKEETQPRAGDAPTRHVAQAHSHA